MSEQVAMSHPWIMAAKKPDADPRLVLDILNYRGV